MEVMHVIPRGVLSGKGTSPLTPPLLTVGYGGLPQVAYSSRQARRLFPGQELRPCLGLPEM